MSNDTLLREVDEALRGDRMRALWKRFGPYVIGAAVAIVVIVAVNEGWSWWQKSNAARSSDQFYAALELAEGTDIAAAQEALNRVAAEGSGGYPTLARFRQAGLLAQDGKTAEAIAAYDALATSETNARIRELALVLGAYLLVDAGDVAAVQQRIGGLLAPENPMRNAAREAMGLAQYKAGDVNAARETFEAILNDPLASQELRGRIQVYVAQLIAEGAVTAAEATEAAPSVGDAPAMDVTPPAEGAAATPAEGEATGN
ncbi:MAG: tetratricopeptide repeat protein [Devosia sp.]|nr:tetratricopeptide repeat protein [Devosia sp.]